MSPITKGRVTGAASGLIAGVVLCMSVLKLAGFHRDQINDAEMRPVSLAIARDLRLLDSAERGDTNLTLFLLETDLDSSIIALYTTYERMGELDERNSNALIAGITYRKGHPFKRTINGVDRGELVEETIKRILNNDRVFRH
jgi:hypothetical protein